MNYKKTVLSCLCLSALSSVSTVGIFLSGCENSVKFDAHPKNKTRSNPIEQSVGGMSALTIASTTQSNVETKSLSEVVARVSLTKGDKTTTEEYHFDEIHFQAISLYLARPKTWLQTPDERAQTVCKMNALPQPCPEEKVKSFTDNQGRQLDASTDMLQLIDTCKVAIRYRFNENETARVVGYVFTLDADGDMRIPEYAGCIVGETRLEQLELGREQTRFRYERQPQTIQQWHYKTDCLEALKPTRTRE